jgi:hypothetical protein
MLYLNKLHARGEANGYYDLMIRLFADHERKMLLPFLKKCENYKLDQALEVCKRKNYVEEASFISFYLYLINLDGLFARKKWK